MDIVDLSGRILRQTDKAILYMPDNGDEEIWLPKSQLEYFDEDSGDVSIPQWLAEKHNLD